MFQPITQKILTWITPFLGFLYSEVVQNTVIAFLLLKSSKVNKKITSLLIKKLLKC